MKLLPRTESLVLRWVLLVLVVGCIVAAGLNLRLALAGNQFHWLMVFGLWFPLAVGLWLRVPVARWVALFFLWSIAIVLPLGLINPFAAMDELGPNPPPVWQLVALVAPWVIGALFAIHVLGKHKNEFRWRRDAVT